FVKKAPPKEQAASRLPPEVRDHRDPYGMMGRDGAMLELERALRGQPAGVLIHGLGGVGKTTLARGLLRWLEQTGGLGDAGFSCGCAAIRSAECVSSRLGEALIGPNFAAAPPDQQMAALEAACKKRPLLIVWDNFESARGIAGTAVTANLSDADCDRLRDFLA